MLVSHIDSLVFPRVTVAIMIWSSKTASPASVTIINRHNAIVAILWSIIDMEVYLEFAIFHLYIDPTVKEIVLAIDAFDTCFKVIILFVAILLLALFLVRVVIWAFGRLLRVWATRALVMWATRAFVIPLAAFPVPFKISLLYDTTRKKQE